MKRYRCRIGLKAVSILSAVALNVLMFFCFAVQAGNPHAAYYSPDNNRIFWFIQISDIHIGARGSQDEDYLAWIVNEAKSAIEPAFIVASGDLTDSTNGNLFGWPNGPHQEEWDQYKGILANKVDADSYYDIPGNHDAYSDQYFAYYLANSIQGQATGNTQLSWTKVFPFGIYHFLGVNSADNTGDPFSLSWPWGDYAGLDQDELDFINNQLALHSNAMLTLVFGHHPVTDTGYSDDTWLYYGAPEFIGYLDSYGVSVYGYGHTHRSEEALFAGDAYTGYMAGDGIFYFNVPSLGKSDDWHYSVVAIDCNGISSVTQAKDTWPVVLITAPVDRNLGVSSNPYAHSVPTASTNPIRALVFDVNTVVQVQYRIDGTGDWNTMTQVTGNPYLWEGVWDASGLSDGNYTIEVEATSSSGTRTDSITTYVEGGGCTTNAECDDGFFCNGAETCVAGTCQGGSDPCPGQRCDEAGDACVDCLEDGDCDDGLYCNGAETCVGGICQAGANVDCDDSIDCTTDSCNESTDSCDHIPDDVLCDDGLFCNGAETCDNQEGCQPGSDSCPQYCDETEDTCYECETDPECDDGFFCNGAETCTGGTCQAGGDPCPGQGCDEVNDVCIPADCDNDGTCDAGEDCNSCPGDCISGTGGGTCDACFKGKCDGICNPKKEGPECADCALSWCCGDGVCEGAEDSTNCAIDCGQEPFCGDGTCDPGEECNCSDDCGAAPTSEVGLCNDTFDNDCDGLTDCDDPDCTGDPACPACGLTGAPCTSNADCCASCNRKTGTCR